MKKNIGNVLALNLATLAAGKIEYRIPKPALFEMPAYEYLRTGDVIGRCMSFGREKKDEK